MSLARVKVESRQKRTVTLEFAGETVTVDFYQYGPEGNGDAVIDELVRRWNAGERAVPMPAGYWDRLRRVFGGTA